MIASLDSCLVRQCAPTLAGLKLGNMFCLEISDGILPCDIVSRWNVLLNSKGVRVCIVAKRHSRYFIYVYRHSALLALGTSIEVQSFLQRFGYKKFDMDSMIETFRKRMLESVCFPHEVGIFLGYPLDDVRDFIANGGKNYKAIGCWKVYNDEKKSERAFESFKKCSKDLWKRFVSGAALEKLTVAA